ncbi:MAG: metallo-beta-lactamase family protein [Moraxellaceae bacterium]|jgi:glyoxylase-like metal-dependent hydrolase (beta-lactamase superfamily II)|nr:metallo-beta-lactamase family protein [Moraxellaceae bacterium]
MLFRQLFDQESSTYTYLLADTATGDAVIIDPVREQVPAYLQLLRDLELTLVAALDTHVHADHITGLGKLREATGCLTWMGEQSAAPCVSARFSEGSEIAFGGYRLRTLYTPGHTDDSYCFLLDADDHHYAFTGDTLLIRGTGRTDFQNGSARDQYHSLFDRLLRLPGDTLVYPAHDYKGWTVSTIAEENACNPRLQVSGEAEYVAMMSALQLPNPKLMDVAVPANRACGTTS